MANPAPPPQPAVTFKADIMPMFYNFAPQMAWRLDLTSYADVKTNALLIMSALLGTANAGTMPPPPYPPLTQDQIDVFAAWIAQGCPEG